MIPVNQTMTLCPHAFKHSIVPVNYITTLCPHPLKFQTAHGNYTTFFYRGCEWAELYLYLPSVPAEASHVVTHACTFTFTCQLGYDLMATCHQLHEPLCLQRCTYLIRVIKGVVKHHNHVQTRNFSFKNEHEARRYAASDRYVQSKSQREFYGVLRALMESCFVRDRRSG
jgi:hypothetical protein